MWMITSVRWSQYRYIGDKLYSYIVIKQQHQQLMASKFGPLAGHSYRGHGTSEGIHPELRRTAGAGASDAEKAPDVSNAAERTGRTGWLHHGFNGDLIVIQWDLLCNKNDDGMEFTVDLPVPAWGGAEIALGLYYKTFLIYRTCMRRAPARPVRAYFVRSCCTVVVQEHDLRAIT